MGNWPRPGASTLTKVPSAVPVAKPRGRAATDSMYSKYASRLLNSGSTVGVSPPTCTLAATDDRADDDDDDVDRWVCCPVERVVPMNAADHVGNTGKRSARIKVCFLVSMVVQQCSY
jgi:hypothetical protein